MAGGAGVARAGLNIAKKRGRKITGKDYLTAASAGEGIVAAGAQAESIRKQTEDGLLTPTQAILATGSGIFTGVLGRVGGLAAQKLGVIDIDAALAGQSLSGPEKDRYKIVLHELSVRVLPSLRLKNYLNLCKNKWCKILH